MSKTKNKKLNFNCENCGDINNIEFDGYNVGDTLLEGLTFLAKITNNKLTVSCEDPSYLKNNFNAKKWMKYAKDYVENCRGDQVGICPTCKSPTVFEQE